MKSFRCRICDEVFPVSLHHEHHKIPKALGGSDEPSNLVDLCQADHNLLHTIAYMLIGKNRKHEVEPTLAAMYPNNPRVQKMVLEYAGYAAREMALKKEIKKDADQEGRTVVELPQRYMELLRLAGYDLPRANGKPVGVSSLIRLILADYLSRKYPMRREEILSLRTRKPRK